MVEKCLQMLLKDDRVHWTFFQELLSTRKIRLTDLVLDRGELILDREDFIDRFAPRIEHRNPSSMYQLLIGDELKELIMVKMIMQETEDYIKQVHEKARIMVEPNPVLLELADEVAEVLEVPLHLNRVRGIGPHLHEGLTDGFRDELLQLLVGHVVEAHAQASLSSSASAIA